MHILVAGGTGYVGGRLVPRLLEEGHEATVLTRHPHHVEGRWGDAVEALEGNLLNASTLPRRWNADAAVYLVHSLGDGPGFAKRDRQAAHNFAHAARDVDRVVYLGGLQPLDGEPSPHLASRAEVGRILRLHTSATELRAGPLLGAGSEAFQAMRSVVERTPVVPVPPWARNTAHPMAVDDAVDALVDALHEDPGGVVPMGAADTTTVQRMLHHLAEFLNEDPRFVPVPVDLPGAAAEAAGLLGPVPPRVLRPLFEGARHPEEANLDEARDALPHLDPAPVGTALRWAVEDEAAGDVPTHWASSAGPTRADAHDWHGLMQEHRTVHVDAPPETVFDVLASFGGDNGWPSWRWVWKMRGALDRLAGGPGLHRGRRVEHEVRPGDVVDFWRVEQVERPRHLRMRAELRFPGQAWIEWSIEPDGAGSRLTQTMEFIPKGSRGFTYERVLYPLQSMVFAQLAGDVAQHAEEASAPSTAPA